MVSSRVVILASISFDLVANILSKFAMSTVNNANKDKWLMDKPEWFNKP